MRIPHIAVEQLRLFTGQYKLRGSKGFSNYPVDTHERLNMGAQESPQELARKAQLAHANDRPAAPAEQAAHPAAAIQREVVQQQVERRPPAAPPAAIRQEAPPHPAAVVRAPVAPAVVEQHPPATRVEQHLPATRVDQHLPAARVDQPLPAARVDAAPDLSHPGRKTGQPAPVEASPPAAKPVKHPPELPPGQVIADPGRHQRPGAPVAPGQEVPPVRTGNSGLPQEHPHPQPTREPTGWRNFNQGVPFMPTGQQQFGWQDQERFRRGFDPWFFNNNQYPDPNCERWKPSIHQESSNVANLLVNGATVDAATELNADLHAMRYDRIAQDQLLYETAQKAHQLSQENPDANPARLYLGGWNPARGSWDTIEVVSPRPPEGYAPDPSYFLQLE